MESNVSFKNRSLNSTLQDKLSRTDKGASGINVLQNYPSYSCMGDSLLSNQSKAKHNDSFLKSQQE